MSRWNRGLAVTSCLAVTAALAPAGAAAGSALTAQRDPIVCRSSGTANGFLARGDKVIDINVPDAGPETVAYRITDNATIAMPRPVC